MSKQAYRIDGDFQMGRVRQTFSIEMIGADEAAARQALLADMGSRHGVPRRLVTIKTVKALKAGDITDPIVRHRLQA